MNEYMNFKMCMESNDADKGDVAFKRAKIRKKCIDLYIK